MSYGESASARLPRHVHAFACGSFFTALFVACSSFSEEPAAGADDAGADAPPSFDDVVAVLDANSEDSPPGDAAFSVSCGPVVCSTVGQFCCRDLVPQPNGYICAADACPSVNDPRYDCDDTADCTALGKPGTVCCGSLVNFNDNYYLGKATCILAANCVGATDVQLCDRAVAGQCAKACLEQSAFPKADGTPGSWGIDLPLDVCQR